MAYRARRYYTAVQMSELWDRWQKGETLKAIGRVFEVCRKKEVRMNCYER
jgi:hypothetical protein